MKKRDTYRLTFGGGGGGGSDAQGAAEQQLAGISQDQWNWYKANYLPAAEQDVSAANNQAGITGSFYQGQYIPEANALESGLTTQAQESQQVNNQLSTSQAAQSGVDTAQSGQLYGDSNAQYGQSNFLNGEYNANFLPELNQVEGQANYTGSQADQDFQAALAKGTTDQQFANQNNNLVAKMQQAGISGNSGQMLAVQQQNATAQAAAESAAMTQARNNAVQLGFTQKTQAAQLASGLSGAAGTAASAGAASSAAGTTASNAATSSAGQSSSAANSAVSNASAPMAGLSTIASGYGGAQQAATSPLTNETALSAGLNGGAQSASQAGSAAGGIANQEAATQAQQGAATSQAIGQGIGAAAGIAALALL